jgi:Tfp pilus assembly protein PilF
MLFAAASFAVRAQTNAIAPARPHLAPGADTNSGQSNYEYGIKMVNSDPEEAARAFYWASRIDPSSGDALYALRAAKVLAMNADEFTAYMEWHGDKRTPQQLALDSLVYRAYLIDPFTFGSIDAAIMRRSIEAWVRKSKPKIDAGELAFAVAIEMQEFGNRAWFAYTQGKFDDALRMYAEQLKAKPMPLMKKKEAERAWQAFYDATIQIHAQRGLIFYMVDSLDSARAEMSTAIEGMSAREEARPVLLYQSKAMYLQALGMIHERAHHPDLARDAYGAALQEDLSSFAAHAHIAGLLLAQGDTTGALSEMDLAVQLQPDDAALRYRYATILVQAKRDGDAAAQLRKAIALDPWYGAPHLLLARIADVEQYTDEAIAEYRAYLGLASKTDLQLLVAKERLSKLTSTVASSQAKQ